MDPLERYVKTCRRQGGVRDSKHDFTKGKWCLISLVACYDAMTGSVDKERATDVTYLDFCKAFDMVPPNTVDAKFRRWVLWMNW